MTKQELLKRVHELLWKKDDLMDQEELFELQHLVGDELILEHKIGNIDIKQRDNGFIHEVIVK